MFLGENERDRQMQIHDFKGFPNPTRVRVALAEKGLTGRVSFVHVDVPAGAHKTQEFRRLNPSAAVPVLVLDDGTAISECTAITEYLDHLDGDPALTGRTAAERGEIAMMSRKVEAGFLDAVAAFFHNATPGLGPEVEGRQFPEWGVAQRERAVATLRWMEEVLADREYLAAGRFTVADITALAGFAFAGFVGLRMPEDCPRVAAYRARIEARPSAVAAAA